MAELASLVIKVDSSGAVTGVRNLKQLEDQGARTEGALAQMGAAAKYASGIMAGLAGALTVSQVIKYADAWTDLEGRVRVAVGPMGDVADMMQRISGIARQTYSSLETTSEAYLLNASVLTQLGYSTKQQLDLTEALSLGLVVSGAKADRAASVMNALSKAMAAGKLQGDNFNTVIQTGGEVADALARGLGVSVIELREMAAAGELTTERIVPAMIQQLDELRDKADSMPATIGDAFQQLSNSATQVIGSYSDASGAASALSDGIMLLADNLETVADVAVVLATVFGARLAGAAVTSAASMAAANIEAIRYQATLARMAGVSKLAAAGITTMGAAARAASAGMALLGGPVGTALAAAGALAYFAFRASDSEREAEALERRIGALSSAFDNLSKAQAREGILDLEKALKSAQGELTAAQNRVDSLRKMMAAVHDEKFLSSKYEELIRAESALDKARDKVEELKESIGKLQEIVNRPESGTLVESKAYADLAAKMRERIALFGKETEEAKLSAQIQLGFLSELSEAEQQRLLELARQYDALEMAKKEREGRLKSLQLDLDEELAMIQLANTDKLALEQAAHQARMEFIQQAKEEQLVTEQEANVMMLEEALRYQGAYTQIMAEESRNREQIEEEELRERQRRLQATQQMLSNFSTLMNSQSKKLFEAGKVAAIANALLSAKGSVVDAYKWGTKIGGPVLGSVFAAAAATATAVQVQQIRSQQFGGGGTVSSAGGSPGVYQPPQPTQPYGPQGQSQGQTVQVIFNGPVNGIDAQHITDTIKDAVNNSDFILIETTSRNGQMLAGR